MDSSLEELKSLWQATDQKLEQQNKLSTKMIKDMTEIRYKNKFSKLHQYEMIGSVICFIMAMFLMANLKALDTWYLQVAGIFCLLFLTTLPIVVLQALLKIRKIDVQNTEYAQLIIQFRKAKEQLMSIQKSGLWLNVLFLLLYMPLVAKIFNGKDILLNFEAKWAIIFPVMLLFLFFFTRWGLGCYKRITQSAEDILQEMKND